ncbi:MAG TPA: FAD-binding oxidoreductase [Xanthobacteraceae bacterium]|nr:FAD-binding oxidoreductase [Xanthobacteraceae bacterium]
MGVILQRVASDTSMPPALYGAAGVEAPVGGAARWSDRLDVAIVGGGVTGLWTAYHLALQGARVGVLEARGIGSGASGRAFGQLVPFLKHDPRKVIADYGAERGERLAHAVAAAPTEISGFLEKYQITCAATRSGLLCGALNEAGRRSLEETAAAEPGARMLYGADAAEIIGSDYYQAVYLDPRGFHLDPLAYTRGLARVASAHGALLYPDTRVEKIARAGSQWEIGCGARRLVADKVVIATNAYSGRLWPSLARSMVPFLIRGAVTEPLPAEAFARILPQGQPLTDTRRLYSGVRKFGGRLHISIPGASFRPGAPDAQESVRKRLAELYPWLRTPRVVESWSGWIALTTDQYPRLLKLADGVFAGIGCNGRGLALASILGRDLAALARGGDESATTFPLTRPRPFPLHDAAAAVVAATVATKRWLDRRDATRRQ